MELSGHSSKSWQLNWTSVQRSMHWKVAITFAAAFWVVWFHDLNSTPREPESLAAAAVCAVAWVFSVRLRKFPHELAAALPTVMTLASILHLVSEVQYEEILFFLPIPVLSGALLVAPWFGLLAGLASCIFLHITGAVQAGTEFAAVLSLGVTIAVLVICLQELRNCLKVAWQHTGRAVELAEQLKERQSEVNRLNASLKVSNRLLRRSLRELALAQQEAQQARLLKEQFATTVSHELRTPLNIILGFLEVIQRYPEVYGSVNWTPALRRDLNEIWRSAKYLSSLIDDILDLARVQALKMPMRREPTDICTLIKEVAELASRFLLEGRHVRLAVEVEEGLPPLHVDRTRIRQVLLNLVANACRFVHEGEIRLRACIQREEVVFSVSDTGPGIAPEHLESIFDEFAQAPLTGSDKESTAGKGLGLAIAKRFVQMHGGRIWAESQLGKGSTFYFTVPLFHKQVIPLPPPPSSPGAPKEEKEAVVVVVGDENAKAFLERRLDGCHILLAADLEQARKAVHELHPQAVIVNVPPDPIEATETRTPLLLNEPLPVIQCTLPSGWLKGKQTELFDSWLVKPVSYENLIKTLGKSSEQRRVLIVDDDQSFVRLVRRMLEAYGGCHEVTWAHDGQEALAKVREFKPDVLFLDLALPKLDGWALAQMVREGCVEPCPTIVAVTAMHPNNELNNRVPRSFAVTSWLGFTEEEIISLVHASLNLLRPRYGIGPLAQEPE